MKIGVHRSGERYDVTVWAPRARSVSLVVLTGGEKKMPLKKGERGYWRGEGLSLASGDEYLFELDGQLRRADPASSWQPNGVHSPSAVVDHASFPWRDESRPEVPLEEAFIYELHIGTFTGEGTFRAAIRDLDRLRRMGVNTLEVMPVAQFPGERNWGYDGVYPFSVQDSYGGSEGMKNFVDEAHLRGFAVILDVVYNHLGPEGNYLRDFGPYFTSRYRTPWGEAINFDGEHSDEVRNFFIENALHWAENYHVDGLRLDAVHGIFDMSAVKFLEDLRGRMEDYSRESGRKFLLIAESDLNDSRLVRPAGEGGFALDGTWSDDFHHALHALLTGEREGYYADFGELNHLVRAFNEGYVYSGQYSAYRRKRHGNSSRSVEGKRFVVFAQNHDQVGNRMKGERLSGLVGFEALKLAASCVMLSPYVPLIFMGEEFAERAPFLYFVSHGDESLVEAVRRGRKEEFASFGWEGEPDDPQSEETFSASKLRRDGQGKEGPLMERLYGRLYDIRRDLLRDGALRRDRVRASSAEAGRVLMVDMDGLERKHFFLANFSDESVKMERVPFAARKTLDTASEEWLGPGCGAPDKAGPGESVTLPAKSCSLYTERRG